jgi:hypothetical protein
MRLKVSLGKGKESTMSKENVAMFVRMLADKKDLNKRAAAERTAKGWSRIAYDIGLEFTADDVSAFVGEVIGKKVTSDDAVPEFLKAMTTFELSAAQLDLVRGVGGILNFSADLGIALTRLGFVNPGSLATYTFPPDHSRGSSLPGGFQDDPAGGS